jgi:hypothetical protein
MNTAHSVDTTMKNIDKLGRKFSGTTLQRGTNPLPGTYCHISSFVAFTDNRWWKKSMKLSILNLLHSL